MRLAGYVCTYGEEDVCTNFLVGKPEGKRQLGRLVVDGIIIILEWILQK